MSPLWVAVVGAIAGAVFGALAAIGTTSWVTRAQLGAQARYTAERKLKHTFRSIAAQLEIERRGGYPTLSTSNGPFDIHHREQLAIVVLRNIPSLRRHKADAILDKLTALLGEEAVLYCDARADLPDGSVDIPAEHAAKSIALIPKAQAGTLQTRLIPEIGKRFGDDREQAFTKALEAIHELSALVGDRPRGRHHTDRRREPGTNEPESGKNFLVSV